MKKQRVYRLVPYLSKDGWRLRLKAGNGKIPLFEAYSSRSHALRAGRAVAAARIVVVE